MVAVFVTFFVTLSVFPGVIGKVTSKRWGDWMQVTKLRPFLSGMLTLEVCVCVCVSQVVLVAIFNLCDFLGKVVIPNFQLVSASPILMFAWLSEATEKNCVAGRPGACRSSLWRASSSSRCWSCVLHPHLSRSCTGRPIVSF
jgi:hypothetical protein